jgi:hypothetical protein
MRSMHDGSPSSGTMIIGIVLYKDRFDVCVTNAEGILQ